MSTLYLELPVKLSPNEAFMRSKELARKLREASQLEAEKKVATSQIAAKVKALKEEILVLSEAVDSGKEKRKVLCKERFNEAEQMIETIRLDTDTEEVVASRPLKDADRQMKLRGPGDDDDDDEDADDAAAH
jgi:hypothetical protein